MKTMCQNWLAGNKRNFGTHDGLPGEFHREFIFNCLGTGKIVAIETPHGSIATGRVVMRGPAGWVACDDRTGGAHPLICNERNTVWTPGLYFKPKSGHNSILSMRGK
jgi:hypothetical protein